MRRRLTHCRSATGDRDRAMRALRQLPIRRGAGSARTRVALGVLAVFVALVLVASVAGAGALRFASATNYGTGSYPHSVAVGDLNGDERPDLATANVSSNDVSVLLQNADHSFAPATPATTFGAHTNPYSVARAADLNGDQNPDLVVANINSNDVSVLLGDGHGSFASPVNYGAHTNPTSVAVGDLNPRDDHRTDVVVTNYGSNDVSVLLGNADGTFQPATNYTVCCGPFAVAVGKLNTDAYPDLVVADANSNNVSVLLGNGDGTFQSAGAYGAQNSPESVTVGYLNADDQADLVVGNSADVSVLLGNGDGTFQTATTYAAHSASASVAVSDLDADGKADLIVANNGSDDVSLLLGNGDGTFQPAANLSVHSGPYSVAVADLNGDTTPDLATANAYSNDVSVLFNLTGLDTTPPTSAASAKNGDDSTYTADNWTNQNVTVSLSATDDPGGSGVKSISYSATGAQTIEDTPVSGSSTSVTINTEGTTTISYHATDNANNAEAPANTFIVKIDKTDPTVSNVSASSNGSAYTAGTWTNHDVTVSWDCADPGGSGVVLAHPSQTVSAETSTGSVTPSCSDTAGNSGPGTAFGPIQIDKTAPSVSCDTADGNWHANDVSIACTASDQLSRLANPADGSFSLSTSVPSGTETSNASTSPHDVLDFAGNKKTAGPISGNQIDKKRPTISISAPINGTSYLLNKAAAASWTCSDGGSGSAFCRGSLTNGNGTFSVTSGSVIPTSYPGAGSLTVNSTDNVGNIATPSSNNYSVLFSFSGFFSPVANAPTINQVTSGHSVAIPFRLLDANGASVFNTLGTNVMVGTAAIKAVTCPTGSTTNKITSYTTATGTPRYDSTNARYEYDLAITSSLITVSGSCRQVTFKFRDGTSRSLYFSVPK
jgi:FG-GAP-like repeat